MDKGLWGIFYSLSC